MKTLKLKINSISDEKKFSSRIRSFSSAIIYLYNAIDLSSDDNFIKQFCSKYHLDRAEYTSVTTKAKALRNAELTRKEQNQLKLQGLLEDIEKVHSKKKRLRMWKKINKLTYHSDNKASFGGKSIQRELTKEYNKTSDRDLAKIERLTKQFKEKRQIGYYSVGEGNQKGNRRFDLSNLSNGTVLFKLPNSKERIKIDYNLQRNTVDELRKVQELVLRKELAVTVSFNKEYIYFTFDEQAVNGFSFDLVSFNKDKKDIKNQLITEEEKKQLVKEVYKRYCQEQKKRMMVGKIPDRCIAIDMNPTNIGFSVLQRDETNPKGYRILHCGCFDMSALARRLGLPSNDEKQIYQNNKRKFELKEVITKLFNIANHYKCSIFAMEDLSIKPVEKDDKKIVSKEVRRKINNLWNRCLIENLITKKCNECGIELRKVPPYYSSFIGNIQHSFMDSTNASIEIGRRGIERYIKGRYFPPISIEDLCTVQSIFEGVVIDRNDVKWKDIYESSKEYCEENDIPFEIRWRAELGKLPEGSYTIRSMSSYKSRVKLITFNDLY